MGGYSYSKTKPSSVVDKRLRQLSSELPPAKFSIDPKIIETNPWLNINRGSSPAITKSWLPTTTRCLHQPPQLCHVTVGPRPSKNPNQHQGIHHFLDESANIADTVYEMPNASHWCFLKSDTNPKFHQPPTIPCHRFDLLGPPLQLNGVNLGPDVPSSGLTVNYTVYRNYSRNSCWYKHASIQYECTMADPFDAKKKNNIEFVNLVHYEGKFYALSLQGALVVMQVLDTRLKITGVGRARAVPSAPWRFFKEYLVEMKGGILLVFLIHERSLAVVDNVEVFRLDSDRLEWVKVERMRGKTMFLKEKCDWVDSEEFGCRDNCVYFTQGNDNSWRVYDMKTCCISSVLLEKCN